MKKFVVSITIIITIGFITFSFIRSQEPQKLKISSELKYRCLYCNTTANEISYSPDLIQNISQKLTPGLSIVDSMGIEVHGDTFKITPGHYKIKIINRMTDIEGDSYRIELRFNGLEYSSLERMNLPDGCPSYGLNTKSFTLFTTVTGYISFWITNLTSDLDPTFIEFMVYIEKKPF